MALAVSLRCSHRHDGALGLGYPVRVQQGPVRPVNPVRSLHPRDPVPKGRSDRSRLRTMTCISLVVFLLAAGLCGLVSVHWRTVGGLATAHSALLEGRLADAERALDRLEQLPWATSSAQPGRSIVNTATGVSSPSTAQLPSSERLALRRLCHRELVAGRLERCFRLAQLAILCGDPAGHLFTAAVSLCSGDLAAAHSSWSQVPHELLTTRLADRISQALPILDRHGTVLRDRRGHLLGAQWRSGSVQLARAVDRNLVPPRLLDAAGTSSPSGGVRLTVDLELARAARAALSDWHGSIVLLDARTGELLAAVSDPETAAAFRYDAPFRQRLEPASIMKILTVAAALRGGVDVEAELAGSYCNGALRIGNSILWCPSAQGAIFGLDDAFAASCNTAFARLGLRVGRARLLAEHHRWGFGAGGWRGRILAPRGNRRQLADLSIGLNATDITPVHAALLATPIATGRLAKLTFRHADDSPIGLHPEPEPLSFGSPILDPVQRRTLQRAMHAVTGWGGTAALVAPQGFQVAMKTGTGGNRRPGFHVNYIGVGPLPDPWLAFSVRVTGIPVSQEVRRAGFFVTQRLLASIDDIETRRSNLRAALLAAGEIAGEDRSDEYQTGSGLKRN